jgi:hypothetical protein
VDDLVADLTIAMICVGLLRDTITGCAGADSQQSYDKQGMKTES